MKRLHWIILRRLPGPFFGWLGTLMFLLLMQFLIRWLPEIAGKGIPLLVIVELIVYNLAYMLVLAVPMSVLLAALMTFGGLAESQYYAVIKSTGISFAQLVWPSMIAALLVTGGMLYFNNVMLPEANHRARYLWSDIRSKRPGFDLQPGVFYSGIDDYSILVRDRPEGTNRLHDVTIYDYTEGRNRQALIRADSGRIAPSDGRRTLTLELFNGEMHRRLPAASPREDGRYEHLRFSRHELRLDLSEFVFERSTPRDGARSDRTMRTWTMIDVVDSLEAEVDAQAHALYQDLVQHTDVPEAADRPPRLSPAANPGAARAGNGADAGLTRPYVALTGLSGREQRAAASEAIQALRSAKSGLSSAERTMSWKQKRVQRYRVEIYKKFSIAIACVVFMLIGAPLGLSIRRGGLATIGAIALGIFMFYWITLVQGEKLADRGLLPPWVGMWIANVLSIVGGAWLVVYVVKDLRATPPLRHRAWQWIHERIGGSSSSSGPDENAALDGASPSASADADAAPPSAHNPPAPPSDPSGDGEPPPEARGSSPSSADADAPRS